jgi:hypothetical protein
LFFISNMPSEDFITSYFYYNYVLPVGFRLANTPSGSKYTMSDFSKSYAHTDFSRIHLIFNGS